MAFIVLACGGEAVDETESSESWEEDTAVAEQDYYDTIFNYILANEFYEVSVDTFPAVKKKVDWSWTGEHIYGEGVPVEEIVWSDSVYERKLEPAEPTVVEWKATVQKFELPVPEPAQMALPHDDIFGARILSTPQGLNGRRIRDVVMDKHNRMWITTEGGLAIFDGAHLWNINSGANYPFGTTYKIIFDSEDRLWGTSSTELGYAFWYVENDSMHIFEDQAQRINGLVEDGDGVVWIALRDSGAIRFEGGHTFSHYGEEFGIGENCNDLTAYEDELIISSTASIVFKRGDDFYALENHNFPWAGSTLKRDNEGNLWMHRGKKGPFKLEDSTLTQYLNGPIQAGLYSFEIMDDGAVWMATWGSGLLRMKDGHTHQFEEDQGIPHKYIWNSKKLTESGIYCYMTMDGVYLMNPYLLKKHPSKDGPWQQMKINKDKSVWFGEFVASAGLLRNDSLYYFDEFDGIRPYHASIFTDFDDQLTLHWRNHGMEHLPDMFVRQEEGEFYSIANPDSIQTALYELPLLLENDRDIWGHDQYYNAVKFDGENWMRYNMIPDSLRDIHGGLLEPYPIGIDKDGAMWMISRWAIGVLKDNQVKWFYDPQFHPKEVDVGTISKDGRAMFMSKDLILFTFEDDKVKRLKSWDIFPEENVIVSWFDTDYIFAHGKKAFYYGDQNGLHIISPDNGIMSANATISDLSPDSVFYVETNERVVELNYPLYKSSLEKPEMHLVRIDLNSRALSRSAYNQDWTEGIEYDSLVEGYHHPTTMTLDHTFNRLTFYFSATDWDRSNGMKYSYKLEGSDIGWTQLSEQPKAEFNNLKAGDYVFHVKAKNADGIWSDELTYDFTINPPFWQTTIAYLLYILLVILIIWRIIRFRELKLRRRQEELESVVEERTQELADKHHQLEVIHEEITDSIAYAKRIQSAILPPMERMKELLGESFVLYIPKDVVAGDFYWLETVDRAEPRSTVLFAAADCTGHGVPGAMVSVVCNNALNRSVREFKLNDPGKILDKTKELVVAEFDVGSEEVKDGMDVALVSLQRTESGANLLYAGAHNPLWIIRSGSDEIEEIKANKQPIGVFQDSVDFTTHSVELKKGDSFFVFSDGYADQFGGDKGKKMKSANFKRLLLTLKEEPMDVILQQLNQGFEDWKGSIEQLDDVCVIGVRI